MDQSLFPEYEINHPTTLSKGRHDKHNNYDEFVDKFKPKLTTDDCYTPTEVYDVVLGWVRKNCDIEGCNIVRPFYPSGNYEAVEYSHNDVVIDNPPFSIITKIVRFYIKRGIRFFLFAPYLTCFHPGKLCTSIICAVPIIYENGAEVNTAFVSNMLGDIAVITATDLRDKILKSQKKQTKTLPKYRYPINVIRATDIGKLAMKGIDIRIPRSEVSFISKLDSQVGTNVFGGGFLLSDRAAADRAAADRAAADRAAADRAAAEDEIEWMLSERERQIIEKLNS